MSIWKEEGTNEKKVESVVREVKPGLSVLDALNTHFNNIHGSSVEVIEKKEVELDYHALYVSGEKFHACLTGSEGNGDYIYIDRNYKVILTSERMASYGLVSTGRDKITLLGNNALDFRVVDIKEVDGGKYNVYIEIADKKIVSDYRANAKDSVARELRAMLANDEKPVVWGRIVKVREGELLVDLCDVDLLGVMRVSHWQASFTRSLIGLAHEGDYMQFQVIGERKQEQGRKQAFYLSRRKLSGDVWDTACMEGLEEGQQIVVKCKEIPHGKSYWWGVSDRIPGVDIMCDYSENWVANRTIFPQVSYICRIKRIERRKYRGNMICRVSAKPLKVCNQDAATMSRLRRLHGIKGDIVENQDKE